MKTDGRTNERTEGQRRLQYPLLKGVVIIKKNTMSRAVIGFHFIFLLGSLAHKYVLQLYMYVLFIFSYAGYGLVALFTGVDKHVHYAWSAII